ncbi:hypothetical protein BX661DRAFT_180675 [Kickxella alabastrina]|uniref:uncharacterized protein n=1 Tax=Kickxella alabastrina TaxID=61397 RepID=UPI00221E63E0|nr:uncharacterized protein BX661DRAFT_180675 [Kickxella alabastrina]KAI7829886.1 hypothetical protein BX661DRAFT_180675 [Kickxella alabastrina]
MGVFADGLVLRHGLFAKLAQVLLFFGVGFSFGVSDGDVAGSICDVGGTGNGGNGGDRGIGGSESGVGNIRHGCRVKRPTMKE